MHRALVGELRPGMVLGQDLHNARGDTLLSRSVVLSEDFIEGIIERGFRSVFVQDGLADNIERPEMITDRIRRLSSKHLGQIFDLTESSALDLAENEGQREEVLDRFAEEARPHFDILCHDIEKFVGEVSRTPILSGIVSLKSHDNYTFEHSIEVTVAAIVIAKQLSLSSWDLAQLALGCLCHDLGKLVVPTDILNKPGRLNHQEFELVKLHPQAGYEVVRRLTHEKDIIARNVVRQHHEKQNGTGYSLGLRGNNHVYPDAGRRGTGMILQAAEIAAVADVYSAIASDRPYRPAMNPQQVTSTLLALAGPSLNREITERFLHIIPTYPVGTEVMITAGRLKGYRGIVTSVHAADLSKPIVRVLYQPDLNRAFPFEVDMAKEVDIEIAMTQLPKVSEERFPSAMV